MATYAVIVPTLNEAGNVGILSERLEKVLDGLDWEAVFVDDGSTDGTVEELFALANRNPRIRFLRRIGRRGLASACVEGMMSTAATYMAVIDADLQHDETKLAAMFGLLSSGEANVVVGSRYVGDGGTGTWDKTRVGMSKFATKLASLSMTVECSDPMSGFFAIHRSIIDTAGPQIQSRGFKILFDILTIHGLALTIREVPYVFRERTLGETKLSYSVMLDFLWLLLAKYCARLLYIQFIMFCFVGATGVAVHLGVLFVIHRIMGVEFLIGQTIATLVAMTSNYVLNNWITFGRQRLRGKELLVGYGKFALACAVGAFANVACAGFLQSNGTVWFLAAFVGTSIGALINYAFAKFFVWKDEE